jgi:hypothetical protein
MLLAIDAVGWVQIIGAIAAASTVIASSIVLVLNTNKKLDGAAERREQIAEAIIDPSVTTLPPKETK